MRTEKPAIKVARVGEGWVWAVVDPDGATTARGAAAEQQAAMETAWRAARAVDQGRGAGFPEIIVDQTMAIR